MGLHGMSNLPYQQFKNVCGFFFFFKFNLEESSCQDVCILKMTMVLTRQQAAVGFCVQSCVLLSCSSWEPSLYNWFHLLSLGCCRIKGDVLCPGIQAFTQRTEIILSVSDVEAHEWLKLRSVFPTVESSPVTHQLPNFPCLHWCSCTLHGQLGWMIQMKTQNERHC